MALGIKPLLQTIFLGSAIGFGSPATAQEMKPQFKEIATSSNYAPQKEISMSSKNKDAEDRELYFKIITLAVGFGFLILKIGHCLWLVDC